MLSNIEGNRIRLNSEPKTVKTLRVSDGSGYKDLTLPEEEIAFFANCKRRSSTIDLTATTTPSPPAQTFSNANNTIQQTLSTINPLQNTDQLKKPSPEQKNWRKAFTII